MPVNGVTANNVPANRKKSTPVSRLWVLHNWLIKSSFGIQSLTHLLKLVITRSRQNFRPRGLSIPA